MKKTPRVIALLAASIVSANAAVVFSENFGSTTASTATTFGSPTVQNTWTYSDSAGTTVNTNESRLFNPGGAGSGENTHGWISALTTGNTFQQITTTGSFVTLPALGVGQNYVFTLTFFASAQTSVVANDLNAYVDFSSAGKSFSFTTGSNGSITNPTNFVSQSLSDSNAAADTLRLGFVAQGGGGGYNSDRSYTASWTSTSVLGSDSFSLALGRTTNAAGASFAFFDNVSLDVVVVPEGGCALLGSFGLLALLRRRRA
ncbi:hypothetical protein OKA05_24670 [Luteolibacter arcticus]|uniref:PEP-CTERM sorting domain-containing protein n=1 Tax=Luteolibacter arcticus TaxID=1581411 RepID=A0ABT3GQL4_9BACT|nr:hypothetical protein [Luteolibacter arcticus]MCW1925775.1 hypothetical protein [Luteolibacter arcticus]